MAILAAGVGFSIRAGILGDWGGQFGFTQSDLGKITGGGLTGFGIIILLSALIADKIGYGRLMIFAFIMHFLSAVVTLAASPIYNSLHASNPEAAKHAAFLCLFWGMFLFAIGNGTCEGVVNPLVATLFPKNKTHYLNILHAGWPAGLVSGGLASYFMVGKARWEVQLALFLIPVILYGAMCLGQRFPKSEASAHGVKYLDMLKELGIAGALVICLLLALWFKNDLLTSLHLPGWLGFVFAGAIVAAFGAATNFKLGSLLLALLLCGHMLLGYVELGTDSWIGNITGNILASPANGLLLFVYTSSLMFILRFCAGPIVHKISPLGLLFVGATCGAIGLTCLGNATTGLYVVLAATIYGIGKTFLWPTMLAVVSERFPKGGAIAIGAMGGVGMLSAGLLGGPGIGYNQDYYASQNLKEKAPAVYEQYKSETRNNFLFFPEIQGLDGTKVKAIRSMTPDTRTAAETQVHDADLHGGRMALKVTAAIPATLALLYLFIILYFKTRGGYRQVHIEGSGEGADEVPDKATQAA
ncbi:MAG: Major Facilitator Superfamily protein [Pedosphaera sp.]|nr:Major Facilitator Superfamily protein [Pedosphaera sp.]